MNLILPVLAEIQYGTRTKSNQEKIKVRLKNSIKEIFLILASALVTSVSILLLSFI